MQAVPVRTPELSLSLEQAFPARPRLHSVDLLRGLVMVLMALDTVRAYFSPVRIEPTGLSELSVGLFLTRWVAHPCAPVFVLLAGAGTYLALANGVPRREQARFLAVRGLGLILLEQPITVAQYGTLPTLRQFDYLRKARGAIGWRQARVVGYGLQGRIPAFAGDDFVRYAATSSVTGLAVSDTIGEQNFKFTNNPGKGGGPGGTCSGDSGGPAFFINPATGAETSIVMAVNSYGIAPQCNGNDYQFRTDIEDAQDFVIPYLNFVPN